MELYSIHTNSSQEDKKGRIVKMTSSFLLYEKTKWNLDYVILPSFLHLFFYDKDYVGKTFVHFFIKCEFNFL